MGTYAVIGINCRIASAAVSESMSYLLLLLLSLGAAAGSTGDEGTDPFSQAMDNTFALASKSAAVSGQRTCTKSVKDLMVRQGIPIVLAELRNLSDAELYSLAFLAAVGGISRWNRAEGSNLILLTEDGILTHPNSPGAVENDLMLCIVCALLTVIAIHHLILPQVATGQ